MGLLSGGERSLGALAFLFALHARAAVAVLRARRGRRRARRRQHRALPRADRALPRARAVHHHHPPEADDGDRRRALRRLDGRRRRLHRALAPHARAPWPSSRCRPGRRCSWAWRPRRSVPPRPEGRRRGFFSRLRENLGRSSRALAQGLNELAFDPNDEGVWERLEELLIGADVGVPATVEIVQALEAESAAGRLHTPRRAARRARSASSPSASPQPLERRALDLPRRARRDPRRGRQRHRQDDDDRQARLPAARGRRERRDRRGRHVPRRGRPSSSRPGPSARRPTSSAPRSGSDPGRRRVRRRQRAASRAGAAS